MNEINRNAAEAQAQQRREEEAAEAALAKYQEQQERVRIRRRKRATRSVALRFTLVLTAVLALLAAEGAGLIDACLAVPIIGALIAWVSVWIGGWMQFMYAEGGLFRWRS